MATLQTTNPLTTTLTTTANLQATGLHTTNPLNLATQPLAGANQAHTFTVTNSSDSGAGSFRQAVLNANADSAKTPTAVDVINFNLGTGTQTITLTSANLDITAKNLTINGTGANVLTLSGNNKWQDFAIEAGANVTISGLTITNGLSAQGGGILNRGTLTLSNDILSNNSASIGLQQGVSTQGGGILNHGTLTLSNDTLSNNYASIGGGIFNDGTLSIRNSTIDQNISNSFAAGIFNSGTLTVNVSTFSNNTMGVSDAARGGGIFNDIGGTLTVNGSTFNNNYGPIGGGGIENAGTLTVNGSTFSNNHAVCGGGIENTGTLTVNGSIFSNNHANSGGGIENGNIAHLMLSNSTFTNNSALLGAAIYNTTGALLNASGLSFTGNTASWATGTPTDNNNVFGSINFTAITVDNLSDVTGSNLTQGQVSLRDAIAALAPGGTITFASSLAGGTLTLTQGELDLSKNLTIQGLGANQLTISGNHQSREFGILTGANVTLSGLTLTQGSTARGGAISISNYASLALTNDVITGNAATQFGGGIFNSTNGNLTLTNSTISNNTANNGGGIDNFGSLSVTSSTINNNIANQWGGGLFNSGTLTLTNDTLSSNQAGSGGGFYNTGTATLNSDTISGNTAAVGGGLFNATGKTLNVHNSIVAKNTATTGSDLFGNFTSLGFNLIGIEDLNATGFVNGKNGDQVGTTAKPIDPKLGALQNNGGTTLTEALLVGSSAINLGDSNNANNPTTDERGIARPRRGRADIGAFELV